MASGVLKKRFYEFGSFRIDVGNRLLYQGSDVVQLQLKTFDLLLLLVESQGRVLEKAELMNRVWTDTAVEESNLTQHIYTLRKLFSAEPEGGKYIETIPRRGYRFVARVNETGSDADDSARVEMRASPDHVEGRVISFPYASNLAPAPIADQETAGLDQEADPRRQHTTEGASPGLTVAIGAGVQSVPKLVTERRRILTIRVVAIVVVSVGLTAAAYHFLTRWRQPRKTIGSVAVAPFKSLNPDGGEEYLGLGLADDLVTRLSGAKRIVVRPTSAVLSYMSGEQDPVGLGRKLAVDAVLTGTVRKSDDRIRVNAQLIRVEDGAALWVGKFDEKLADVFTMQDRISEQLSRALTLELSGEEKKLLTRRYTDDTEAYQLCMKAYFHWKKRTREGFDVSLDYLQQALAKDSRYALAYARLAATYCSQSQLGFASPKEVMPEAEKMAKKALELDETMANAHASLGAVRTFYDWNLPEAEREFQQAIRIDPNYLEAHQYYAVCLAAMGRFAEAREQIQAARRIDPGSANLEGSMIWVNNLSRQYDEAITQCKEAIERNPNFYAPYQQLGQAYVAKQMYGPAIAALQKARIFSGNADFAMARLGQAYALAGKRREAKELLNELHQSNAQPQYIAWVYIGLGDSDRAFQWLEKAFDYRSGDLIYLKTDSIYDRLSRESRFTDLLRRIGFQP